jgi:glycine hydroxymethyltransferase
VANAAHLAQALAAQGLHIPYGGTNTHLLLVDCKSVRADDGTPLMGESAARILDVAGIVCNRNTIPGDETAGLASGIRLGTPWVTQRGLREPEMERLAEVIALVLQNCWPFTMASPRGSLYRARIDFDVLKEAKRRVAQLAGRGWITQPQHGYPHYDLILIETSRARRRWRSSTMMPGASWKRLPTMYCPMDGDSQPTRLLEKDGRMAGTLYCLRPDSARLVVRERAQPRRRLAAGALRWLCAGRPGRSGRQADRPDHRTGLGSHRAKDPEQPGKPAFDQQALLHWDRRCRGRAARRTVARVRLEG